MSVTQSRKQMLQYSLGQIESCIENGEFGRALAHFCIVFKLQPSTRNDLKDAFLLAVDKHTKILESEQKWTELFDCYEKLLEANHSCEELHHSLGVLLLRYGHIKEAAQSIKMALEINPNFVAARQSLDSLKTILLERWHFRMLNDVSRNQAFHTAITAAVQSGHKHVLDIGAGTGLLSLFALSAGADKVYACEEASTSCEVARTVFDENGFGADICIINKHSTELTVPDDLPERVTLAVTETFDSGLFGEHVLASLDYAWEHLLKVEPSTCSEPKATVIPERAEVFACLIESQWIRDGQMVRKQVLEALLGMTDVNLIADYCDEEPYDSEKLSQVKHGFRRLSEPFHVLSVDFNSHKEIQDLIKGVHLKEKVLCAESGIFDALCLWFRLKVGDTWLNTGPDSETCWDQAIYRGPSAQVCSGEAVMLDISCQGHITVDCILDSVANAPQNTTTSMTSVIRAINGQAPIMARIAEQLDTRLGNCSMRKILDASGIPLLGLLLLRRQPSWRLTYVQYLSSKDFVDCFVKTHGLETAVNAVENLEELHNGKEKQYDIFILNVLESSSGLLRQGVFEDIALLKNSCLKPDVTMVPSSVTLRGVLVESEALEEQSRLVSDSRTLGFNIADSINVFQVKMQQDICLATLPHRPLCDVFTLLEINVHNVGLDLPEISAVRAVPLLQTGRISGCCYWFEQDSSEEGTISSCSAEDTSLQAAVVFSGGVLGSAGTTIRVGTSCIESDINIWLDNVRDGTLLQ